MIDVVDLVGGDDTGLICRMKLSSCVVDQMVDLLAVASAEECRCSTVM